MANTRGSSKKREIFSGYVASPSSGDGAAGFHVPFSACHITYVGFSLDVVGSTGNTSLMVNRVRAETDAELLTAVLSIASTSTTGHANTGTTFQNNVLQQGDIVRLDLDAADGSPGGFAWAVEVHIDQD